MPPDVNKHPRQIPGIGPGISGISQASLESPQGQKCPPGGTATAPAGAHHRHPTKNLPPEIKISQASPDLLRFHLDNRVANSFLLINYTSLTDGNIPTPFHNKLFQ